MRTASGHLIRSGPRGLALPAALLLLGAAAAAAADPAAVPEQRLRLSLSVPPAREYSSDQPLADDDRDVAAAVARVAPGLEFSSGLARAARIYAGAVDEELSGRVPEGFLSFALRSAGCPDPSAVAALVFSTEDGVGEMLPRLAALRASMPEAPTHVGAARVADPGARLRWRWAVLMVRREAVVEPFPRAPRPGRVWPLGFTLAEGLDRPEVVVLRPGGETVRVTPEERDGRWVAEVGVGSHAGNGTVEVVAQGPAGPRVVALMPVRVGLPLPESWEGWTVRSTPAPATAAAAEREMAAMIKADRRPLGLPPLAWSPALAAIARAHSEDMRDHGFVGHVSPATGGLRDRLRAAGFTFREAAENISRAPSLEAARASFMASPAHRENILSARFTVVGVGVALGRENDGAATVWVTEIFALPPAPPVPGLLDASMAAAAARGAAPREGPRRDEHLDAVAAVLARRGDVVSITDGELRRLAETALADAGVKWRALVVDAQRFADAKDAHPPAFGSNGEVTRFGLAVVPAGDREVVMVALGIR